MKIVFGILLVLGALLAMILGFAWMDGEFGDSPGGIVRINADGEMTGVEHAYLEFMILHLDASSMQLSELGVMFSNPDLEDQYWLAATYLALNRIQICYSNVENLDHSERLLPFHEAALDALSHGARFSEMVEEILNQGSTTLTEEAVAELLAAGNGFAETEALLNEFLRTHPVPAELLPPDDESPSEELAPAAGG